MLNKNLNIFPHKDRYINVINVQDSIIHNSLKLETTQISTNYKIDKLCYIHSKGYCLTKRRNILQQ